MAEKSFGLSIDGEKVTVVETLGDIAISSTAIDAGSLADSLEVALSGIKQKRKDAPLRIALITPSISLRRIDATASLAASRADFEDAVFAALPVSREVTAVAGAFFDPEAMVGDTVAPGAAVVGPADRIEEIYRLVGKRRVELVASPLVLSGFDGVWLGLHHGVAEVTLVVDGRPVAYRQLRAGGLNALLAVLADPSDPEFGPARLRAAVTGTGTEDTMAAVEVGRYMRMVANELAQTLDYWRKSGESMPESSEVLLYGVGGVSPLAQRALGEARFAVTVPEAMTQALSYVPPAQRAEAVTALCAVATTGRFMPQASFTNPMLTDLLAARRRTRKRLFSIAAAVVVLGGLLVTVARPIYAGWTASRDAEVALDAALAEFESKADAYHRGVDARMRTEVLDTARAAEPDWPTVYRTLLASAPIGASLSQLSATGENSVVSVSMSVSVRGGSYEELVRWLERLRAIPGVREAWSSGFSQQNDITSFVVSLLFDESLTVGVDVSAEEVGS